jgi:hypothetical protein
MSYLTNYGHATDKVSTAYMERYAVSHDALDKDMNIQEETRDAGRLLLLSVKTIAPRRTETARRDLSDPRPK